MDSDAGYIQKPRTGLAVISIPSRSNELQNPRSKGERLMKEMENMEEAKDKFFQMIDEVKQKPERIDYDAMWGVSGYYNDNDGNDIRDRD